MKKISNIFEIFSKILLEIFMSVLVLSVLIQVVNRNFIKVSVIWTEEVATLSFIWIAFLGASLGVKNNLHFKLEILINKLSSKNNEKLVIIVYLFMLIVILVLLVQGINFSIMGLSRTTFTGSFKMFWIYLSIPVSAFLMLIYMLEKFQNIFKLKNKYIQ